MPIPNMQNIDINQLLLSQTQDFYDTQESRNCTYSRDSCIWKFFLALLDFSRGESNSPGFYKFCEQQFMILLLFLPHSSSFSFSFYLVAHRNRRQDEMTRKRIRDNEIKKEKNYNSAGFKLLFVCYVFTGSQGVKTKEEKLHQKSYN